MLIIKKDVITSTNEYIKEKMIENKINNNEEKGGDERE